MNQTEFADLFDLKRTALGSYEEGRAEAKTDTMIKIAEYFKISLDQLLRKEITINEIFHFSYKYLQSEKSNFPLIASEDALDYLQQSKKYEESDFVLRIASPVFHIAATAAVYLPFACPGFSPPLKTHDLLVLSAFTNKTKFYAATHKHELVLAKIQNDKHKVYGKNGKLTLEPAELQNKKAVKQVLSTF